MINYFKNNNLDERVWLGSFMVEPGGTSLNSVISKNYGKSIREFKESSLLNDYKSFSQNLQDISCNSTCPLLLNRELFLSLGGYDEDFDPNKVVVLNSIEDTLAVIKNCSPIKEAVQAGRKITTVKNRDVGVGVPIAIMTPHK